MKLKILNSHRREIDESAINLSDNLNKLIKDTTWPYFIPYTYSREKSYEDVEDPIDTKQELIDELTKYYDTYIKIQKTLYPNKKLNGSISILKLQLKSLSKMITKTNAVIKDLREDAYKASKGRDNKMTEPIEEKIAIVEKIRTNQENIQKALEEIITKLSEVDLSKIGKNDEYTPSNKDGAIIHAMIRSGPVTGKKSPKYTIKISNLTNNINNIVKDNILLTLLLLPQSGGGSSKVTRKKRFISKKICHKKNNNKITKKKCLNKNTRKRHKTHIKL